MEKIRLHIENETSQLKEVVLGTAISNGTTPTLEEAYDPKSMEHITAGTYPKEQDMVKEMTEFQKVLQKYGVTIYRPKVIEDYNQIFSRDIGFVIEDKFIKSNILPEREKELDAIQYVLDRIESDKIIKLSEDCHIEGGDVMPHFNYIFVGTYRGDDYSDFITARTNEKGVQAIQDLFPSKKVKSFNLRKSNTVAQDNALHLDCCFQPVGKGKAIIHKNGFLEQDEYDWLVNLFGKENVFEISKEEMYDMTSNVFSISEEVVVSDRSFERLNNWLREQGITVEEVSYREIAKQEGLLRCSTLPLRRI